MFLLLTVILYDEATRDRLRPGVYAASVLMYLLGLLSKVSDLDLPSSSSCSISRGGGTGARSAGKRAIATKIPYLVLAAVLVVVNMAQVKTDLPYTHQPVKYLMVKGDAISMYLGLLTGILRGRPMHDPPWLGGLHVPFDLAPRLLPPAVFVFAFWRRLRP